ncbi:helix-turn-helix domain-containing protein [Nocardia sp. NPDC050718]|uniref:TetR/AcrR family transcriptional regulator n=1 Tax=Nocardia sp. NPDC050718 TaxID=3155788 RepID=UPI0033CA43B9
MSAELGGKFDSFGVQVFGAMRRGDQGLHRRIAGVIIDDNNGDGVAASGSGSGSMVVDGARRAVRLTPEMIVEAAVRIAARGRSDGLTGRALGEELGVDRSAVWRHFADKDALLRAVGDRLLTMAYDRVPDALDPKSRMERLAHAVVDVFTAHPYVGAAVASRTTRGPGEFAVVEMMLTALGDLGLEVPDRVRYQRMLADSVLAYAGFRAGYALLPKKVRDADERAWAREYAAADPREYPAIAALAPRLAEVGPDTVLDTLIEAFWAAVEARRATSDRSTQND